MGWPENAITAVTAKARTSGSHGPWADRSGDAAATGGAAPKVMVTVDRTRPAKMISRSSRAMLTASPIPAAQPASRMFTTAKKIPNGGKPSRATMPTNHGTARPGRRVRRARTSAMTGVPSAERIRPETTKSVALISPWASTYSSTAGIAGAPMAAPRAMTPMCSMLEYASIRL